MPNNCHNNKCSSTKCNCHEDNNKHSQISEDHSKKHNCHCESDHSKCGCNSKAENECKTCGKPGPNIACDCGCDNDHKDSKISKILFSFGTAMLIFAVITSLLGVKYVPSVLYVLSYISIGCQTFVSLAKAFRNKVYFGENTLMTVSSLGAMIIGEAIEGCMVMLLFRIGEMLEHKAVENSENNIKKLLDMSPKIAERITADGTCEKISPKQLCIGDIVVVKPGASIPCDGEVTEGCANTDTSSITGESVPLSVEPGSVVRCGYINLDSPLKIKVTSLYEDNSFSKIISILSENCRKKSRSEAYITKFAKVYTPIVMVSSLLIMLLGSIITGNVFEWIYKGLVCLAASCPCAFVISVPLTFFLGAGESAKNGLLVKGSEYIEKLSKLNVIAFDKTGTLTKGDPEVVSVTTYSEYSRDKIVSLCASVEQYSSHPLAVKIAKYATDNSVILTDSSDIKEVPGEGISGIIDGKVIKCGNAKILQSESVLKTSNNSTTKVYICENEKLIGLIEMSDTLRNESYDVVQNLYTLGIRRIAMITGDNSASALDSAEQCGITEVYSQLDPCEKTEILKKIKQENQDGITAFVGDGINDAPVLSVADIGIAVGGTGADISVETADAVILGTTIDIVVKGIKCAKTIMSRVRFNIAFAIIVKTLIMILAFLGVANMWIAVFGDVGVTLIVILNALRKIKIK